LHVAGQLGQQFVGGNADGTGQAQFVPDAGLELIGDGLCRAVEGLGVGDIQEGFINGDTSTSGV